MGRHSRESYCFAFGWREEMWNLSLKLWVSQHLVSLQHSPWTLQVLIKSIKLEASSLFANVMINDFGITGVTGWCFWNRLLSLPCSCSGRSISPSGSYRRDSAHFFAGTCFLPRLADWDLLRPREGGRQAAGRWENWGSLHSPSVVISLTWW